MIVTLQKAELEAKLVQLYRHHFTGEAEYAVTQLGDGLLIRIHTEEGFSQLFLVARQAGIRNDHQLLLTRGHLFKPNGEFIQFRNVLALPKDIPFEQIELTEEHIVEMHGTIITSQGERLEFEDRTPKVAEVLKAEPGCRSCSDQKPLSRRYVERKVGAHRCWLCTGITLGVGTLVSLGLAWLAPVVLKHLFTETLQWLALLSGLVFTVWRAWWWGYLPFQDRAAYMLGRVFQIVPKGQSREVYHEAS